MAWGTGIVVNFLLPTSQSVGADMEMGRLGGKYKATGRGSLQEGMNCQVVGVGGASSSWGGEGGKGGRQQLGEFPIPHHKGIGGRWGYAQNRQGWGNGRHTHPLPPSGRGKQGKGKEG